MCKTVGIVCNNRWEGKVAGWLLAHAIEDIKTGVDFEKFQFRFNQLREQAKTDPSEVASTNHVVLDSFGEHILDHVRQFCPVLIEYDLHDDGVLENYVINPRTFEVLPATDVHNIVSPLKYSELCESNEQEIGRYWLTLEGFILYFAHYTMKRAFGENVWVNVASATTAAVDSDDVRIWWDVKTEAEYEYIHTDCRGYVLKLDDPAAPKRIFTTVFLRDGWVERADCSAALDALDADTIYKFANTILKKS